MATGRISKRTVDAVAPPDAPAQRNYLWDDKVKGFGLMVTGRGARSYIVQYRLGGRGAPTRRYTIGQHGSPWTPDTARARAVEVLELVRRQIDPLEAEREQRRQHRDARKRDERLAFAAYADLFVKEYARARGLRSSDDIAAVIRRDLKPAFRDRPLPAISRADVRACLDAVGARSGAAANKAHAWLRKLFAWAVDRGDLASSPMAGMPPPHVGGRRERVLKGNELRLVWEAAGALGHPFGSLVKLLMLTGQRLREVAGMRWDEVDLDAAVWRIPGTRTKNRREHLCPLSPPAVALLAGIQPDAVKRKGVVLTTNGKSPVSDFSGAKARLDELVTKRAAEIAAEIGGPADVIAPWVFHDLRRSLATGCQALGIPIEHTEAVLNHVSGKRGGLVGVYQLHEYEREKAAALAAWATLLDILLSNTPASDNVVAFAKRPRRRYVSTVENELPDG